MEINIIHLVHRKDRLQLLKEQVCQQGIINYKIWDGIIDLDNPCIGISRAHKQIIEYAKHNKIPEILIGEDDLCFTSKGAFSFYLNNKPNEYDIYLAGVYHGKLNPDNTINEFVGTTLYMVHERFYNTFLEIPENKHLDRALKNKGVFVVCNPFTVIPQDGYSDNMKQFISYEYCFKDRDLFGRNSYHQ